MAVGKTLIRSQITGEEQMIEFAVQHWGDHQVTGGVRQSGEEKKFLRMKKEVIRSFGSKDPERFQKVLQKHYPASHYALQHLFKDEQLKALYQILDETLADVESGLRQINEHHYPIIQVVRRLNVPLPRMLMNTVSVMLDTDILRALASDPIDFERLESLVREVEECHMEVDKVTLAFVARRRINELMQEFLKRPRDFLCLETVQRVLTTLKPLKLEFEFWTAQNIYFWVGQRIYLPMSAKASRDNPNAKRWLAAFENLGIFFNVHIDRQSYLNI